jgi:transposase
LIDDKPLTSCRGALRNLPVPLALLFFLPKYSPDLNPIEQVFAKLKHLLRTAAARTFEAICLALGNILFANNRGKSSAQNLKVK